MLYPNLFDQDIQPKNNLERDLYSASSGAGAYVFAYVSKMFAVPRRELQENKVKPLTAEELRTRGRAIREARQEVASDTLENMTVPAIPEDIPGTPETPPPRGQ